MKNKKIKMLTSLALIIVSLLALTSVTYAWFISDNAVNEMGFQVLQIDSQVTVFFGEDFNYNGILDQLDEDKVNKYIDTTEGNLLYTEYKRRYYDEKNAFRYFDSKYALSVDTSANTLNEFSIENLAPSKIYTVKFDITNYAGFENNLSLEFASEELDETRMNVLSNLEVRAGVVDEKGKVNYLSEFISFTSLIDGKQSYSGLVVAEDITISKTGPKAEDGRLDVWMQIKVNDDFEIDSTSNIESMNIKLPTFFVNLSASNDEALARL